MRGTDVTSPRDCATTPRMTFWWLTITLAFAPIASAVTGNLTPLDEPLTSAGFEKVAREDGVTAFKHTDSDVIGIAAEGRIDASPDEVRRALIDYDRQVGIISRLSEAKILDREATWLIVYQRLNLPVVSDRDYTLHVRWGNDDEVTWITFSALAKTGPEPRDGVVRVAVHDGSWQLRPLDGGSATFARFQTRLDLGGWVPMWLARANAGRELLGVFRETRSMVDHPE